MSFDFGHADLNQLNSFCFYFNAQPISADAQSKISEAVERLLQEMRQGENSPHAWCATPNNMDLTAHIATRLASRRGAIDHLVIIGSGGSISATRALIDVATHAGQLPRAPRVWYCDNIDPIALTHLVDQLAQEVQRGAHVQPVIVSKSGTTAETATAAAVLWNACGTQMQPPIIISDEASPLAQLARANCWELFTIPARLGGRFSACSAVTLVPLYLYGADIVSLRKHACAAIANALFRAPQGLYAESAHYYAAYLAGYRIFEIAVEQSPCFAYGMWLRQLIAESLGKENSAGERVGFAPLLTTASADYHSILQYTLGGPRTVVTRFVGATIPQACPITTSPFQTSFPCMVGKTVTDVHRALCTAVHEDYRAAQIPCEFVTLPSMTPDILMAQMYRDMMLITVLGYALDINPFNQPQVTRYKKLAEEFLRDETTVPSLEQ